MAKPVVFGGRQRSVEESRNERVLRRDADSFSGAPVHGLWVEIEFSRPFDGDPTLMDLHLAKEVRVAQGQKDTTVVEEKREIDLCRDAILEAQPDPASLGRPHFQQAAEVVDGAAPT